ncbi:MAG: GNAT family N-acetyltransferase [Ruminococcus sp.]|nr:GNAT family N-acetyltransferase [Ruminococcus sp.]
MDHTDIYQNCPVLENGNYIIRLIEPDDAKDLLSVYSDKLALPFFNSDNCHGTNFYCRNIDDIKGAINAWIEAYKIKDFVRFSVVDKAENRVIGTIELFHRNANDAFDGVGVLRLDLGSQYENRDVIFKILNIIVNPAFELFNCDTIITKAPVYAMERIEALKQYGFEKSEEYLIGHLDNYPYRDYWTNKRNYK